MSKLILYFFLLVFAFAIVGLTACTNPLQSQSIIDINTIAVYPNAQPVNYDYNVSTTASDRQARRARLNGHHSYSIAFVLPKGTTAKQVKDFYMPVLNKLGGVIISTMSDRDLFGTINLEHGSQSITIEYDSIISDPPTLIISDFIPNYQP